MPRLPFCLVASLLFLGCGDDGGSRATGAPPATTTITPQTGTSGDTSTTTSTQAVPCCTMKGSVRECGLCPTAGSEGMFCLAIRELGQEPQLEEFLCQQTCLPTDLAGFYCGDDSSCCDPQAHCDQATGYCRGGGTTGSPTSTSSGSTAAGSSTAAELGTTGDTSS